jgi:hypothetical protein
MDFSNPYGSRIVAIRIVLHLFWEHLYRAAQWACKYDVPRILEPCMAALPMYSYNISKNMKAQLIWSYAGSNGSTRVLSWFLKNMPNLMRFSIQYMYCENSNTVKWCIENLLISPPAPVNWVMMKTIAIVKKNTVSTDLLDWVVIPPCPLDNGKCGVCPACMIRNNYIYYTGYPKINATLYVSQLF